MTAPLFWPYAALLGLSYLAGSLPFAYLAVRLLAGEDLRRLGTGNLGARNAGRLLGWPGFLLVFLLDAGKGFLAVRLAQVWLATDWATLLALVGVLLGHSYSVFLGFSGGKGLASAVGALLALSPPLTLALLLLAGLFLALTRNPYLAAVLAAVAFPPLARQFLGSPFWTGAGLLPVGLILWRHRRNLGDWFRQRRERHRGKSPRP